MGETVLVPVDGSEPSWNALAYAADQFSEEELVVYHVVSSLDVAYEAEREVMAGQRTEAITDAEHRADELFEEAERRLDDADVEVTTDTDVGTPARAIVEYVQDHDVDHVAIGSHGRSGIARAVLGSVAEKVLRHVSVPVTVVEEYSDR